MDDKLIKRIDDWNRIKYPNNKETRIIIATLKPKESGYTWKQEADDIIEEYNTWGVTTAPNIKE